MKTFIFYLRSSIGRKKIMGITGLMLAGFVFLHMMGNILLFFGPQAYNLYGHVLTSGPFYYLIEAVLCLIFILHITCALSLTMTNIKARTSSYTMTVNGDKSVSFTSKTMIYHGAILAIFLVYHLMTIRFGPHYAFLHKDIQMRDLFKLVEENFSSFWYVIAYAASMFFLLFHLSHGIQSSFQSFGFNHEKYTPGIKKIGNVLAFLIAGGFLIQSIYMFFYFIFLHR